MKTYEILDQLYEQMESLCKEPGAVGYGAKRSKECLVAAQNEKDLQTRVYLKQSHKDWGLFTRDLKVILDESKKLIQKFEQQENKKEGKYEQQQRNSRSIENTGYGYYIATRNRILRFCRQWWPSA